MQSADFLSDFVGDFVRTCRHMPNTVDFAKEHRLWEGLMAYRWLSKLLFILALILGLQLFSSALDWWGNTVEANQMSLLALGDLAGNLFKEGYDLFVIGGLKYVVLILAEIVIFHFARRTLEVVTGREVDHSFAAFVKAQKRMIYVAVYSFVKETFYTIIAGVILGILSLSFAKPGVTFLIQCFFLGFAIIDNYNEIFHMTLKQSFAYTKKYAGVALAIGIPVYLIMLVPLVGTIAGPVLGAIVATITMNELLKKDGPMDWVFEEVK